MTRRWATAVLAIALAAGSAVGSGSSPAGGASGDRPLLHFTPTENWMNDPNGLVFVDGTWHLFFQHNPFGDQWGNMSWGHATSTDLANWDERPLAIAQGVDAQGSAIEDVFSGSIVYDVDNTSGLGTAVDPPLVAIYTSNYTASHQTRAGTQAQSVATSTDGGETWTKYEANPVLDRMSASFRDPKVFRYDGSAGSYWVMVAVEAIDREVVIYRSDDLIEWSFLSSFRAEDDVDGMWEVPDLFELPVEGDPTRTKWVLLLSVNPGGVAGGSGVRYFVGEFDGTTFVPDRAIGPSDPPTGAVLGGFDGMNFDGWAVTNEPGTDGPFGVGPVAGSLAGQASVEGFLGAGLVNSFHGADAPTGSLTSPPFTIDASYINLLVGGGDHPHRAGTQIGNEPPAGRVLFEGFEPGSTLAAAGWELTDDFAADAGLNPSTVGGDGVIGAGRVNTFEGGPAGDDNVGVMTSPSFTIGAGEDYLSFLLGGGRRYDGTLEVQLLVDGAPVRSSLGPQSGRLDWQAWDVAGLAGKTVRLRLKDDAVGSFGHLTLDHPVLGPEPALPRSDETSVNLVVDGKVVRSATGRNSEHLAWTSWFVGDLIGSEANVQIVDANRSSWGHILVDHVMTSGQPSRGGLDRYQWLDWGRDHYATMTYNDAPDGRRVAIGWMSNWDYAGAVPTSPWRGAMTLPRELRLVDTDDGFELAQGAVPEVDAVFDPSAASSASALVIDSAETTLASTASVARIDVALDPGSSTSAGITVFGDGELSTRIGFDVNTGRVFVDRRGSADPAFHPAFPSFDDAPIRRSGNPIELTVYLDRTSVEVFADGGRVAITDLVFPEPGAEAITAWAEGGTATFEQIVVTPARL